MAAQRGLEILGQRGRVAGDLSPHAARIGSEAAKASCTVVPAKQVKASSGPLRDGGAEIEVGMRSRRIGVAVGRPGEQRRGDGPARGRTPSASFDWKWWKGPW